MCLCALHHLHGHPLAALVAKLMCGMWDSTLSTQTMELDFVLPGIGQGVGGRWVQVHAQPAHATPAQGGILNAALAL